MLINDVRPTTLGGVKRLAKEIKKSNGGEHSDALERAAKAAGCANYVHARRTLPKKNAAHSRHYVLLTIYWRDKDRRPQCGRETLRVELSRPILEICGKNDLKYVRDFGNLRMVADDHFVCDEIAHTQDYARSSLCKAGRSLRFMEHTGLLPSREFQKGRPEDWANDRLPGVDHATHWVDPASAQFILVDEPYGGAPDEKKRADWAVRNDWRIEKTSWAGIYWPYECDLYVAVDNNTGYALDALVAKINAMPDPVVTENWPGESAPLWDTFVSPMAKTKQEKRRARCKGTTYKSASKTTVPYRYGYGNPRRRPNGKLEIDNHIKVGRAIKAVMGSEFAPSGIFARLSSMRHDLEDWLSLEIGRGQLEGPEFFEVYYSWTDEDEGFQNTLNSAGDLVAALDGVKQQLKAAYPDCAPLRQQIHRIDMSISMIDRGKKAQ